MTGALLLFIPPEARVSSPPGSTSTIRPWAHG